MKEVNQLSEIILKLIGMHPLIGSLLDEATEVVDGEYGTVGEEELNGVCYSHYTLIEDGKLCSLLNKHLSGSCLEFFRKVADENLDLNIERNSYGSITLSLHLDVPVNPNADVVEPTFPLDVDITESNGKYIVRGSVADDIAQTSEKYLPLYSLMG